MPKKSAKPSSRHLRCHSCYSVVTPGSIMFAMSVVVPPLHAWRRSYWKWGCPPGSAHSGRLFAVAKKCQFRRKQRQQQKPYLFSPAFVKGPDGRVELFDGGSHGSKRGGWLWQPKWGEGTEIRMTIARSAASFRRRNARKGLTRRSCAARRRMGELVGREGRG